MNRLPHISRPPRPSVGALRTAGALLWLAALCGCTNNPYPNADASRKVFYEYFVSPPRTLDPATAYSTTDHVVTGPIFDTLLEYHYLKRPYTLIPGLAESLPSKQRGAGGEVVYRFRLRPDLLYQDDDCFALSGAGRRTRTVTAADVAFEIERLADPQVNSPVVESFGKIRGFEAFSDTLRQRRADDASFSALRVDRQYALAGGISGVRVLGPLDLEIVLDQPYPQILYWFAMPFTSPVPWEAVAYYDGEGGRGILDDHPVGAGPFRLVRYERRNRIVLERNENWYGIRHPEWRAPGAVYPDEGEPADAAAGLLDADMVGRPLPFLERIEILREPEPIPAFVKFLQGYYDISTIVRESFDRVVREGALSRKMAAKGMRLVKGVTPAIYYLGFNMDDPVVGKPAGARGRALRQAMSLAVDSEEFARLFMNGRGIPAQSPLPPGIFGYDPDYRNPYRRVDLERAAALLRRAGYPNGIDPRDAGAAAAHLRHQRHQRARRTAVPVLRRRLEAHRARRDHPRHQLQRVPGKRAPRRLPGLLVGLGGRLSRTRRTSSSCSTGRWGARAAAARTPPTSPTRSTTSSFAA